LAVTPLGMKEKSFIEKIKRDNSIMRDKSMENNEEMNIKGKSQENSEEKEGRQKEPDQAESPLKSSK